MSSSYNAVRIARLKVAESAMKGIMTSTGPKLFAAALNNISVHGEMFNDMGLELDADDQTLHEWFDGIEKLASAASKME